LSFVWTLRCAKKVGGDWGEGMAPGSIGGLEYT